MTMLYHETARVSQKTDKICIECTHLQKTKCQLAWLESVLSLTNLVGTKFMRVSNNYMTTLNAQGEIVHKGGCVRN